MRFHPILLPLLAAALLGACTGSATGATPPGSTAPASPADGRPAIDGRTFVSISVAGRDLVAGSRVTLRFTDGRLGANAGCNSMSGGYSVVDGKLKMDGMATTEMACPQPLMDQDAWLAAFLPGASISIIQDTLTVTKDAVTMRLVDQQTTNLPLEGTTWVVDGLISGDAVSSVPQGVTAALRFAGGRVEVRAGCNQGSGPAAIADGTIRFGAIALTRMMCAADAMAVEQQVVTMLQGTQPYAIAGDSLTIGGNGKPGLTLKGAATAPQASDPGPS